MSGLLAIRRVSAALSSVQAQLGSVEDPEGQQDEGVRGGGACATLGPKVATLARMLHHDPFLCSTALCRTLIVAFHSRVSSV